MTFFNYNFLCVQSFTLEFGVAVLTAFFTASDLYFLIYKIVFNFFLFQHEPKYIVEVLKNRLKL